MLIFMAALLDFITFVQRGKMVSFYMWRNRFSDLLTTSSHGSIYFPSCVSPGPCVFGCQGRVQKLVVVIYKPNTRDLALTEASASKHQEMTALGIFYNSCRKSVDPKASCP